MTFQPSKVTVSTLLYNGILVLPSTRHRTLFPLCVRNAKSRKNGRESQQDHRYHHDMTEGKRKTLAVAPFRDVSSVSRTGLQINKIY